MKSQKATKILEQAIASQQAGDLHRAGKCYRRYLKSVPDDPAVMHILGGLYYQLGELESAGQYLEKAHKQVPENMNYLNDLGAFRMATGDYEGAVKYLRELVNKSPENTEAWYNLGLALHGTNRMPEALHAFEEVTRLKPDYAAAWYNMGVTLQELGQYAGAEDALCKAINFAPMLPQAHLKLGEVLTSQRRMDSALGSYRKAFELDRKNTNIIMGYAEALHNTGRTVEAIEMLRERIGEIPANVVLLAGLGKYLHIAGQIHDAESVFRQALSLKQDASYVCSGYSRIRKFSRDDNEIIGKMEDLLDNPQLSDSGKVDVHFALGKIYDDCGNYDKAFSHYSEGNAIQHRSITYDRSAFEQRIDETIEVFTAGFFEEYSHLSSDLERPVFIVGMPRSGTTLTEQIIASHPQVAGAGELLYFSTVCNNLQGILGCQETWPSCSRKLDIASADKIRRHYLELLDRHSSTARLVTDKLPGNYLYIGLIRLLFPKAPIIHCRREPLDMCLSIFFQYFNESIRYAFDLMDIGHNYQHYERLMNHWRKELPGPYMEIQYEDLVANQEHCSRELIDFIGLDWDDACLTYYKTRRDVKTASNWQVRQPLYASSVGRWKKYEKFLQPLMQLLSEEKAET